MKKLIFLFVCLFVVVIATPAFAWYDSVDKRSYALGQQSNSDSNPETNPQNYSPDGERIRYQSPSDVMREQNS